ncbi:RNA methyltransferase [Nocardioides silvaticus]|uniref:RNA methyltransferase n=1 Tax=Nocardioides silvaticus TaxID=2201891 RepID=A0A316TTP7_9ACTN|nr:TfoX/Sxy family protein [Nocardioides silvaticus]PWN02896.1 RNA methyltransferase [Nocardioides silvaticus]
MAYDEVLAARIRDLVGGEPLLTEQRMFGGLAFLIGGNMAVAASSTGGILVRVDRDEGERLVATTPAYPMEMRGREMSGWLRVEPADVASDAALAEWVRRGVTFASALPPKQP